MFELAENIKSISFPSTPPNCDLRCDWSDKYYDFTELSFMLEKTKIQQNEISVRGKTDKNQSKTLERHPSSSPVECETSYQR